MPISLKNSSSILPWIRYCPQANAMTIAGEDGKSRGIQFIGKAFAVDIESGMPGWLLLGEGLRDWKPAPLDSAAPDKTYKRGFSVLFFAPKLFGSAEAFEMCASTGAHLSFCERLYNECEPKFGKGMCRSSRSRKPSPSRLARARAVNCIRNHQVRPPSRRDHRGAGEAEGGQRHANKNADTSGAANTDDGGDFDCRRARGRHQRRGDDEAGKATAKKPKKGAERRNPNTQRTSDILDDPIPY